MTNSTNHNLKGDDMVSAALETEHIPSHQVHPLSMFTRCLQDLFKQINITISPTKVFAVSLSEVQESVVVDGLPHKIGHP